MKLHFFLLIFLLLSACEKKTNDNILDKQTFTKMLIDIHFADAILKSENLQDIQLNDKKRKSYYNYIFKKYNTNRETFYRTLKFYTEHLKEFKNIQNIVTDSIQKKVNILDSLERTSQAQNNIWTQKTNWQIPKDGQDNSIPFYIKTQKQGTYILSADIYRYEDDLTKLLTMTISAIYSDSTKYTVKKFIGNIPGKWSKYSVKIKTDPKKQLVAIKGKLLKHSISSGNMHIRVRNISLIIQTEQQ